MLFLIDFNVQSTSYFWKCIKVLTSRSLSKFGDSELDSDLQLLLIWQWLGIRYRIGNG